MVDVAIGHVRGDTVERSYKFLRSDMTPANLAGTEIRITIKPVIDNDLADTTAEIKHFLQLNLDGTVIASDGITVGGFDPDEASPTYNEYLTGAASGVITHFVQTGESTKLEPKAYVYDVQVRSAHTPPRVKTVIENAPWTVRGDVTRIVTLA